MVNNNDSTAIEKCRGKMSSECARGMDGACRGSGLYKRMVNRPLPESAVPAQCETANPNYTYDGCFKWLEPFIVKSSLVFDYRGFMDLPRSIDRSFRGSGSASLRYLVLQYTDVTVDLVTKNDELAILPVQLSKMDNNAINVEGSTAVSSPSTETFLNTFDQSSETIELSHNYLSFAAYTIFVIMGLLF